MNDKAMIGYSEMMSLAQAFARSGFFKDAGDEAKAIVKIAYGRELGISPVAAMCGIYLTSQGKLELDSGLIGALIKDSGRYDYLVREHTNDACQIEFFENGKSIGVSRFDANDAKRAGLATKDTYGKYPRNLYFARALTNGARWFCPNIFGGAVYAHGEISGANEEAARPASGTVVEAEANVVATVEGEIVTPAPRADGNGHAADTNELRPTAPPAQPTNSDPLKILRASEAAFAAAYAKKPPTAAQMQQDAQQIVFALKATAIRDDVDLRHALKLELFQTRDISPAQRAAMRKWLGTDAAKQYIANFFAKQQAAPTQTEMEAAGTDGEPDAPTWDELGAAEPQSPAPLDIAPLPPAVVIPSTRDRVTAPAPATTTAAATPGGFVNLSMTKMTRSQKTLLMEIFMRAANDDEDAGLEKFNAAARARFNKSQYELTLTEADTLLAELQTKAGATA